MEITFDGKGLEALVQAMEDAAGLKFRQKLDKKIVTRATEEVAVQAIKRRVPRSKDNSKSGRKGSRPSGHAADNVPTEKAKATASGASAAAGWTKADASEHFYVKFVNWGTLKMPPRDFLTPAAEETTPKLRKIAEEEYATALDDVMGRAK